jgi:putative ABC transport system ATP-binding protein
MIILDSVHVVFSPGTVSEKVALKNVSLNLSEGEFVTIIGSNGAGKSTLLNVISGEVFPRFGKILINGKNVTYLKTHERSADVARVFQDPLSGTCGDLTVAENICLAKRRGKKRRFQLALTHHTKEELKDIVKILGIGLENNLDVSISLLSGGQRQAISLLMATQGPSKILLLDEHTAALDPKTAEFVMEITHKLIEERGLTVLMVTHSLHQALAFGKRTIMIHNGQIIYDIKGKERQDLTVDDLLKKFSLDDDRLLLQK